MSPIPVVVLGGARRTLDLWARDLEVQVASTTRLKLFCPALPDDPAGAAATRSLPPEIEVLDTRGLDRRGLRAALAGCDVLQLPGHAGWWDSRDARRMLCEAQRVGIPCIVGISSNRARATLVNARSRGIAARARAAMRYAGIRLTQRHLTARAEGAFVVGEGLRPLVSPRCGSLHVSIASWIREDDWETAARTVSEGRQLPVLDLCIAARLEPMKGVHVGIEAFSRLCRELPSARSARLTILGVGPELEALQRRARDAGVADRVTFGGTRSYPDAFFAELRRHGVVLLTNLGDEQPRLVFDAISQGCLPVCPDSRPFASLGLPPELVYARGDPAALAAAIRHLWRNPRTPALLGETLARARAFTLESMHRARAAWIEGEILTASPRRVREQGVA